MQRVWFNFSRPDANLKVNHSRHQQNKLILTVPHTLIYCNVLIKKNADLFPIGKKSIGAPSKWKFAPMRRLFAWEKAISYLIAKLLALRWFHLWFISSSRLCSMTASSWLAKEPSNFRPAPFRDENTSRWHSISLCKSWKHAIEKRRISHKIHERRGKKISYHHGSGVICRGVHFLIINIENVEIWILCLGLVKLVDQIFSWL